MYDPILVTLVVVISVVLYKTWESHKIEKELRRLTRLQRFDGDLDHLSPQWMFNRAIRRERAWKRRKKRYYRTRRTRR